MSGWQPGVPTTPPGSDVEFIIACKRANGKVYVFSACYLNAKLLLTEDDDCPEDGKPFSGWYQERADDGDYDTAWVPVECDGAKVLCWHALPQAPDAATLLNAELARGNT